MRTFEEVMKEMGSKTGEDLSLDGPMAQDCKALLAQLKEDPTAKLLIEKLIQYTMILCILGDPERAIATVVRAAFVQGFEVAKRMYSPDLEKIMGEK